jgi:hypothetical protein
VACTEADPVASDESLPAEIRVIEIEGRASATPYVASNGDFLALVWSASEESGATDLYAATSEDGGVSFTPPVRVNDFPGDVNVYGEQPPRVALGSEAPPRVYVAWTSADAEKKLSFLRLARSVDGGKTFEPAATLHAPDIAGARGWHSLAISPSGQVHSLWLDGRPRHAGSIFDRLLPTAHAQAHQHAAGMGLYHLAWDGSASPQARRLFEPVCECCKTAMAVGGDGSVYAAWRHIYEDNYRDIAFAVSRDGAVFGDAVRVNEDGWQINGCPDDGPAMVVDGSNRAHLIWPTVVHEKTDMGIFYASTADGVSFSPRSPLPGAGGMDPSHPQLAIDGSGRLAAVWDEMIEKKRRVVMTRAVPAGDGAPSWSEPELLDDGRAGSSATYPVVAASGSGALVAWTSQAGGESVIRVRRIE